MTEQLLPPQAASVLVARPIFQVLADGCLCAVAADLCDMVNGDAMRVTADQYGRPDRILL